MFVDNRKLGMALSVCPKSLFRLWRNADRRLRTAIGYDPYGWDWPTIAIVSPSWFKTMDSIARRILASTGLDGETC